MAGPRVSRRSVLGTVGAASLAPVLPRPASARLGEGTAGVPPAAVPAFHAELTLSGTASLQSAGMALIAGGRVAGRLLAGEVEAGQLQWHRHPAGLEVALAVAVRCADGRRVELVGRGVLADADLRRRPVLNTNAELLALDGGLPACPTLLVGRLDLGRLGEGATSLLTYEVS